MPLQETTRRETIMPKARKKKDSPQDPDYELAEYVSSLILELHKMAMQAGYGTVCTHLEYAYYEARGSADRHKSESANLISKQDIGTEAEARREIY